MQSSILFHFNDAFGQPLMSIKPAVVWEVLPEMKDAAIQGVITALHMIGFVQSSTFSILRMDNKMISECSDQYLDNPHVTSWSLPHQIASSLDTVWFHFCFLFAQNMLLKLSLTVSSTHYGFVAFPFLSIIIFAKYDLVEKNICPWSYENIILQVTNYRLLLPNFWEKWEVICPEGTWSSHEGIWPHVS